MRSDPVTTPLSGPRISVRIPEATAWEIRLRPLALALARDPGSHCHDVQVGPSRVRLVTNDDHLVRCLRENFAPAEGTGEPVATVYARVGFDDDGALRRLLQIETEDHLQAEISRADREWNDPYFRLGLPEGQGASPGLPHHKRAQRALRRPIAFFHPPEKALLILNSNDYGETRARGILGGVEADLAGRISVDDERKVIDPGTTWVLLHGSALPGEGMVFIGPDGSGRQTLVHGLHVWKDRTPFLPSAAILVRLGDRLIHCPERRLFVRTHLGRLLPESAEAISAATVENAGEGGAGDRRGRALLDPVHLGKGKGPENPCLSTLVIVRRDYDDPRVIKEITFKEAMGLLTAKEHSPVYHPDETDPDGYCLLQGRRTEPYFNPCVLQTEIDLVKGRFGELDRKRIAAFLHLAQEGGTRLLLVNPRLPPAPTQLCARKFLAGECDSVEVLKGTGVPDDLIWSLGLKKRSKPAVEGRREVDRLGYFREQDEAEVVAFFHEGSISELLAFAKGKEGRDQIMAYSRAAVEYFFKSGTHLGVEDLFR